MHENVSFFNFRAHRIYSFLVGSGDTVIDTTPSETTVVTCILRRSSYRAEKMIARLMQANFAIIRCASINLFLT